MKPHNHAAPGLGRINDAITGMAKRIDRRIGQVHRVDRPNDDNPLPVLEDAA